MGHIRDRVAASLVTNNTKTNITLNKIIHKYSVIAMKMYMVEGLARGYSDRLQGSTVPHSLY